VRILALEAHGLRNLAPTALAPAPRFNVFVGDNGQGKTNLLEAIYVVAALRSFRTARLADLVQFGAATARLSAHVERDGLERRYELELEPRGRRVRLDGKAPRPLARYFGGFNVVLFAPEDLQLPRGAPADRRRFLDRAVFNRRADYMPLVQDYERVLRSRNALLRDAAERGPRAGVEPLLDVYDEQLAELAARVVAARTALVAELAPRVAEAFGAIARARAEASVRYVLAADLGADGTPDAAMYLARLRQTRARDLARGSTSIGPHRDDLLLRYGDHDAGGFASQGQLRALVLAWKTAELTLLTQVHGEPPILLLDDVSSELDAQRNSYLFDFLSECAGQCFITTTAARHVPLVGDRVDHEVHDGRIR
jgi:DNA replication and repair protein RecF